MKKTIILLFVGMSFSMADEKVNPFYTPDNQKVLTKQADDLYRQLDPVAEKVKEQVVQVYVGKHERSLGFVVAPGLVVTKLSRIDQRYGITCRSNDGKWHLASFSQSSKEDDLLVLHTPTLKAAPVVSAEAGVLRRGSFLVLSHYQGIAAKFGVLSVPERSLRIHDQGFLGVLVRDVSQKAIVAKIEAGSAADQAGLVVGDQIKKVGTHAIRFAQEVSHQLKQFKRGDEIEIEVLREDQKKVLIAVLNGRPQSQASIPVHHLEEIEKMSGERSFRRSGFPSVIQTDMYLEPQEVGAPVLNLQGDVVGMALARAGRIKTYVLPMSRISKLLKK